MRIRAIKRKLGREHACGEAFQGTATFHIDPRPSVHGGEKGYLGTLIHEAIHLLDDNLTEKEVVRRETAITNLLWREGYRKVSQ